MHSSSYFFKIAIIVLFTFVGLVSCRKSSILNTDSLSTNKILIYLDAQKNKTATSTPDSKVNSNIDILKKNLDLSAARTERINNKSDAIIVPLQDEALDAFHLSKQASLTLLLITDHLGGIKSATVVYFLSTDGGRCRTFPENTFVNLLNGQSVEIDGTYKMVTVRGQWLSQLQIKNHRLFAVGSVQQKNGGPNDTRIAGAGCSDWYLVTTYFYPDGTTSQDEIYLGTTCAGEGCGNQDFATLCSSNGDGGGSDTGGDGNSPLDDIGTNEEEVSTYDSDLPPSANLTGEAASFNSIITVTWKANVSFTFNRSTRVISSTQAYKPYPSPASQTFTDDYGQPARLDVSTGDWRGLATAISQSSQIIRWDFTGNYKYTLSTGTITRQKQLTMNGMIVVP